MIIRTLTLGPGSFYYMTKWVQACYQKNSGYHFIKNKEMKGEMKSCINKYYLITWKVNHKTRKREIKTKNTGVSLITCDIKFAAGCEYEYNITSSTEAIMKRWEKMNPDLSNILNRWDYWRRIFCFCFVWTSEP